MRASAVVVPFRGRRSRQSVLTRLTAVASGRGLFHDDEEWASRLRKAAVELGPVFAAFVDYLSTRIDVLPAADCRGLAHVRAPDREWPLARVAQAIAADHADAIVNLADEPLLTTPISQTHRGHLRSGERVLVEVITIDRDAAAADLDLLPLVRHACGDRLPESVLSSSIADFRPRFDERCDCLRRLPLAVAAAQLAEPGARLGIPVPRPELCSPRLLVSEWPPDPPEGSEEAQPPWHQVPDTALTIVSTWLRRVVSGAVFPVATETIALPNGRIVAVGTHARLPEKSGQHAMAYLLALAGDLPDRAWSSLAYDLVPIEGAAPQDEVARAFRSLVPFRDDRTCDSGSDLADHAFLQWRAASRHGWLPAAHFVPFYQGLYGIVNAVRGDGPARDVLADAVRGLRLDATVRQMDEWSRGFEMVSAMERQMMLLFQMPQKLDRLLTVAAEGSVHVHIAGEERNAPRRSRAAALVAIVLAAAAVLVLAGAVAPWPAEWSESRHSIALVVAGGLFVWAVGRVL